MSRQNLLRGSITSQVDWSPRKRRQSLVPALERMENRNLLTTMWVTDTNDSGAGSLRQAILDVNADTSNSAADTIDFNILGNGVQDIQPLTDLPGITHSVLVDGCSQPGSRPNTLANGDNAVPLIELNGSLDLSGNVDTPTNRHVTTGISTTAADSIIRGMVVNNFFFGIGSFGVVEGNFIGTDPSGTQAQGNINGVYNATLVGTNGDGVNDYAERNLISGNLNYGVEMFAPQEVVAGNFIGTDVTGTAPLGNFWGVYLAAGRVGADGRDADPVAERNIISGNLDVGILVGGSNCVIAGNGSSARGRRRGERRPVWVAPVGYKAARRSFCRRRIQDQAPGSLPFLFASATIHNLSVVFQSSGPE